MQKPFSNSIRCLALEVGPIQTNCYLVGHEETNQALVIDPGAEGGRIGRVLKTQGWNLSGILLTHGHFDHIGAVESLRQDKNIPVCIHALDQPLLLDPEKNFSARWGEPVKIEPPFRSVEDDEEISIEAFHFQVLHTPGHSAGSVCFYFHEFILSGDTLFQGSVGRTDLPGASQSQLYRSIERKLLSIKHDVAVFPGHGPATSLEREKSGNPFIAGIKSHI
jgi:glyoxylase-like metal-dependent hydrolase (beta-lactamase superfamily II)